MTCFSCNATLPDGAKFCLECGTKQLSDTNTIPEDAVLEALAYSQEEASAKGFVFEEKEDGLWLVDYEGEETALLLPATVEDKTLIGIDDFALCDMGLSAIAFPPTLKYIAENALKDNKLKEVALPAYVSIAPCAFMGNQITKLHLPKGTKVSKAAFAFQSLSFESEPLEMENLTIAEDVILEDRAFFSSALLSVVFSPKVKEIGQFAFAGNKLKAVSLGSDTNCPENAFDENVVIIRA